MCGDSYTSKGRNVLGDVTNRTLKRGISLILDDAASRSRQTKEGVETGMPENVVPAEDKECQVEIATPEIMGNFIPGGCFSHALRQVDRDLGTCKFLKDSDNHCTSQTNDPLNRCSCSFCLKVAYIWSDLHCQDINGRINALRKSQKEASILAQKFRKEKDMEAIVSHSTIKHSELVSNLFNQWRSLFLHMEGSLAQEINQLVSSLD
ncbi:hypothetical protein SAY87_028801 [Trapa incisa]|uniref:Uncharacterized protein n=1 Tax=Trapa incisa TaxID=236973 RepID=A0AAN7L3J3_9MYRT|nr:hypothetical protein SAY87_028801 [Trapa incisa]